MNYHRGIVYDTRRQPKPYNTYLIARCPPPPLYYLPNNNINPRTLHPLGRRRQLYYQTYDRVLGVYVPPKDDYEDDETEDDDSEDKNDDSEDDETEDDDSEDKNDDSEDDETEDDDSEDKNDDSEDDETEDDDSETKNDDSEDNDSNEDEDEEDKDDDDDVLDFGKLRRRNNKLPGHNHFYNIKAGFVNMLNSGNNTNASGSQRNGDLKSKKK